MSRYEGEMAMQTPKTPSQLEKLAHEISTTLSTIENRLREQAGLEEALARVSKDLADKRNLLAELTTQANTLADPIPKPAGYADARD